MNSKKIIFIFLSLLTILSAKDNLKTYCFESPNILGGDSNGEFVKKIVFSFDDSNRSAEYLSHSSLHYILKNNKTFAVEEVCCHNDGKLYQCDHDITDRMGGYFEFDLKRERINIESLSIYVRQLNMIAPLSMRDEGVEEEAFYYLHYPVYGDLDTMLPKEKTNDENKRTWVKGYACEPIKAKDVTHVYYLLYEYEELNPPPVNKDKYYQYFHNIIDKEDKDTTVIFLANKYRTIAGMMTYEGFQSNWINHEDIELFIYNDKRAFFRIKENVKTFSMGTCLSGGEYLIELKGSKLLMKKFR